jgi:hypothetical protein
LAGEGSLIADEGDRRRSVNDLVKVVVVSLQQAGNISWHVGVIRPFGVLLARVGVRRDKERCEDRGLHGLLEPFAAPSQCLQLWSQVAVLDQLRKSEKIEQRLVFAYGLLRF